MDLTATGTITGGAVICSSLDAQSGLIKTLGNIEAGTFDDNAGATITGGNIVADSIQGTSLTDNAGTLITAGVVGANTMTAVGTVQGATLTDGTLSANAGVITGATNITASGTLTLTGNTLNVINATGITPIIQMPNTGTLKFGTSGSGLYTEMSSGSIIGKNSGGTTTYNLNNTAGTLATTGTISTSSNIQSTSTSTATAGLAVNGYANFGTGGALITSAGGITAVSMNLTGSSGNALTLSGTGGMAITGASAGLAISTGTLQSKGINDGNNGTAQGTSGYILQTLGSGLGYKWVVPPSSISVNSTSSSTLTTTLTTITWSATPTVPLAYQSVKVSGQLVFSITATITSANSLVQVQVFGGSTGATLISTTQQSSIPIGTIAGQFYIVPFSGSSSVSGTQQIVVKIQGNSATSVATLQNTSQMAVFYNV